MRLTRQQLLHIFSALLGLLLFAVLLVVLHRELQQYHYHDVVQHISAIPTRQVALAVLLTALNYLVLTGHDALAFRYLRYPRRRTLIAHEYTGSTAGNV